MYRKIGREIGNIAENKVNLHGLVALVMSDIILSHASSICRGGSEGLLGQAGTAKAGLTMDISGECF